MTKSGFVWLAATTLVTCAWAKLPPPSDEAKAKAAEAAAKAAHTGKVDAYKLCKSMDQVAATYFDHAKKSGKTPAAATQTTPCADPGPFVYTPSVPAASTTGSTPAPAGAAAAPAAAVVSAGKPATAAPAAAAAAQK
jgi:hypothetical protein